MKFFAVGVEGVDLEDVAAEGVDADVMKEAADLDEVAGGVNGVETKLELEGDGVNAAVADLPDDVVGGVDDVETKLELEADGVNVADDISRGECLDGTADQRDFPFIRKGVGAVAGRDPNDFTISFLTTGVAVGDDEIGAEASSIEPKFRDDPVRDMDIWEVMLVRCKGHTLSDRIWHAIQWNTDANFSLA